jgi:hypothetical protein
MSDDDYLNDSQNVLYDALNLPIINSPSHSHYQDSVTFWHSRYDTDVVNSLSHLLYPSNLFSHPADH